MHIIVESPATGSPNPLLPLSRQPQEHPRPARPIPIRPKGLEASLPEERPRGARRRDGRPKMIRRQVLPVLRPA